ncbi:hypothetical protein [Mycolicibacterium aubagnense]|uniref:hypothetical protein n=1 Tax=Mycolicibacterium aubagnense TaxID=319707 RepID=UPI0010FF04F5|nr:hypothetical protein [Mycolicibacterium aubagnense]WGI30912.1 hypothetical protein QDT91_16680 [Mycolicibacterium aubagnense]
MSWQAGYIQPDQVAAAVIAFDTLAKAAGADVQIGAPIGRLGDSMGQRRIPRIGASPLHRYATQWAQPLGR